MNVTFELIEALQTAPYATPAERMIATVLLWKYQQTPIYDDWADLVEDAIYGELNYFHSNRHSLQESNEDSLTVSLVRALGNMGLHAVRQVVGGNCDLTVTLGDYLWIGEAKINTGVSKIWDGYHQLTSRYASGLPSQSRGGMLIYCKSQSAHEALLEWKAALETDYPDSAPTDGKYPLTFKSKAIIASTSQSYKTCHFLFPLEYSPTDKVVKVSKKALAAGQKAKRDFRDGEDGDDSGQD